MASYPNSAISLPLYFDFNTDPRGYDWRIAAHKGAGRLQCEVNVNNIYQDFEYSLKRELEDKLVESMDDWWSSPANCDDDQCEQGAPPDGLFVRVPYYFDMEDQSFSEVEEQIEKDTGVSLTELIHEKANEWFDNTFDLSKYVNDGAESYGAAWGPLRPDYTNLNQYDLKGHETLYDWFVEALEYHANADEIHREMDNIYEIWAEVREVIFKWIEKKYKPKEKI
tara:strand:- start:21 stop:692 length:672 start_codon:yes stop_codon:yes gene_type:complete